VGDQKPLASELAEVQERVVVKAVQGAGLKVAGAYLLVVIQVVV
jgi:hypothetical protein